MERKTLVRLLLLLLPFGILACSMKTGGNQPASHTSNPNTMKERVMGFSAAPNHVNVQFSMSAAAYQLPVERDDFVEIMTKIAKAYKEDSEVTPVFSGTELMDLKFD